MLLALYPLVFANSQSVFILLDCIITIEDGVSINSSVQIELTSTLVSSDELNAQGSNSVSADGSINLEDGTTVTTTLSITLEDGVTLSASMTTDSGNTLSIDETIEAVSSATTLAEIVSVLSDSFTIEENFSVSYESSNSIDDSFNIDGDVSTSFMASLLLQDTISIEDAMRAFQYWNVREFSMQIQSGHAYSKEVREIPMSFEYKSTEFTKTERNIAWSSVNHDTLAWSLQVE